MAAHVTHEIRNPLSAMGLNVELLEETLAEGDPREAQQLLRAIKGEIERLSALSDQYLRVARRPEPRLEPGDLAALVDEVATFVRPELDRAGVALRVAAPAAVPPVAFDEAQIRQALLNLVRNAREAMQPQGGELAVTVAPAAGGGVDLTVDDTGAGIDEEAREKIFEPFFTTKDRGTGLGLAVTRQIVEAHGGTIACEPRTPRGTRFWVHLPAGE
jgi:signal transduction histidine kinase